MNTPTRLYAPTIILSDVHMGAVGCAIQEVNTFLKYTRCDTLILNGDIIDTWALQRGGEWNARHSRFIRLILQKIEKDGTRVIYLRGNHDDALRRFIPLKFAEVELAEQHYLDTPQGRYLVLHGDVFDNVTSKWLAKLGHRGYELLIVLNRWYNRYRAWRGLSYYSFSKAVKSRVKSAVNKASDFDQQLASLARSQKCSGIICGHIHTPVDRMVNGIHYLNSGDWMESRSAILLDESGKFEVLTYTDFCTRMDIQDQQVVQESREAVQAITRRPESTAELQARIRSQLRNHSTTSAEAAEVEA